MNFSKFLAFFDIKIPFCLKEWHWYDSVLTLDHYSLEELSLEILLEKAWQRQELCLGLVSWEHNIGCSQLTWCHFSMRMIGLRQGLTQNLGRDCLFCQACFSAHKILLSPDPDRVHKITTCTKVVNFVYFCWSALPVLMLFFKLFFL